MSRAGKEATGRRSARDGGNGEQASRTTGILSLGQIRGKGNGQRRVFGGSCGRVGNAPDGAAGKVEASEKGGSGRAGRRPQGEAKGVRTGCVGDRNEKGADGSRRRLTLPAWKGQTGN